MARLRRTRNPHRGEASDPYWISFTDLLTALLFVFILATLAFMAQVGQKQQELATQKQELSSEIEALQSERNAIGGEVQKLSIAEDVRAKVISEAQDELASLGIAVEVTHDQSVLSIPSEALGFASGAYEIVPAYETKAIQIGKVLEQILTKDDRSQYLDTVFIEGHTDGRPFTGLAGTGNWGLSTFRAISLWQLWLDKLPADQSLNNVTNAAGNNLISVSGYADTRPISGMAGQAVDDPKNRRIDIRITIVRPSSDDLSSILDGTEGGEPE